ncbi:unnamed protein product [Taenia asiatica]|uniref:USP domain-containing protein n=1 Tax=Taenia asiatica TaxID=60517 RepID=A0A0R3WAL5_TAEAS|nr:unnamed protein product [Taenia asiatica]
MVGGQTKAWHLTRRLFLMAKNTEITQLKRILQELLALFSNLLQGDGIPVSAKSLTDSFGWSSDEVLVHQDIQELNRLLFEQLENNLQDTSEKTLISDLYKGAFRTTIKCLACGQVSERNDEFQDVNLSVSQCDSVEDALNYHTQTEMLVGDNQYFCENCKSRVNATKTSKFTDLPPILTLSLSRFYFNPKTMEACKLDKMCSFPILLDMTTYLAGKQAVPITYDLFSIVIHAGSAACGGHYHAFIKDPYGYTGDKVDDHASQKVNHMRTERRNISPHLALTLDARLPTVRKPPRPLQGAVLTRLNGQSEDSSCQMPPGVETNPAALVSSDSIDRARGRRKTRVITTSFVSAVNPKSGKMLSIAFSGSTRGQMTDKKKSRTYSRCGDNAKASQASTQPSKASSTDFYNRYYNSTTYPKATKSRPVFEPPLKSGLSNQPKKTSVCLSKSPSGSTINIDVSEKSDQTSSLFVERKLIATSGNNEDNPASKQQSSRSLTKSQSESSSRAPLRYTESWRPRLFRQTPRRSMSSDSQVVRTESLSKASVAVSPTSTSSLTVQIKDSFLLNRYHKKDNPSSASQRSEDVEKNVGNTPTPCGALRLTRGGRNPVVYGKWFDFNDDVVTEVSCESFEHVFKGLECAYMLFYKRIGQPIA